MSSQLLIKVITVITAVAGIELIVFLTVTTFNLAIVERSIRTNELVVYTECRSIVWNKERRLFL